jgi:1-phosphofructokinase
MIVTVTLNPAVDKTVTLDRLVLGEVNRVEVVRHDPGGKGINVSRVIRQFGGSSLCTGFVSGAVGRSIEHSLNEMGLSDDFVHTAGQSRTNTTVSEMATGQITTLNESGPAISTRHLSELRHRVRSRVCPGDWLVLAGSVPPGVPHDVYANLIKIAKKIGAFTVLDTEGEALALGLAAGPDMIKPNRREVLPLLPREPKTVQDYLAGARALQARGISIVIVSLGAEGSVAVRGEEAWQVIPPQVKAIGQVGPGDSLVAGVVFSLSQGRSFAEALRLGSAAAAATVMQAGTQLCRPDDIRRLLPQVQLRSLSPEPVPASVTP